MSIACFKGIIRNHPRQTEEKLKKFKVSDDMERQSKAMHPDKNTESLKTFVHHADVVPRKTEY